MPDTSPPPGTLLQGSTQASYYWDDGSGMAGDTGNPAGGGSMHKGVFASPSWPLGTEGYVLYHGRRADFVIGDRGPGFPSDNGIMLDIDGETYAQLTGGHWNSQTHLVDGFGPGHIPITYVILKWGSGTGVKGLPEPFSSGAWKVHDSRPNLPAPVVPPPVVGPGKGRALVEHTTVADANTSAVVVSASHHALMADPVVAPASVVSAMVGIGAAAMMVKIRQPGGIAAPAGRHRHTTGRHRRGAIPTIGFRPAFAM